ncbi:MAG: amidohydrolase family protein [Candidatus Heimdallarchaeota archaeon]
MATNNGRLILKAGKVFDSLTGKVNENQTIAIVDNKIAWIGDDGSFEKEKKDKVIDVSKKFILPGLIETHVHLDYTGNPGYEKELMYTKTPMWYYIALKHAQKHLVSGFTCVRDCGARPGYISSLRRIIDMGHFAGPRLLVSESGIGQWGNQEAVGPNYLIDYFAKVGEVITGRDGVMHAVRTRKREGADFIKTLTTGGVLHGTESKVSMSLWTDDELDAMVTEAHRLGMHLASHAHGAAGIITAVKAGIDTIEHGSFIDEEGCKLMIQNGTYLVPTQAALSNLKKPEILDQTPATQRKVLYVGKISIECHKEAFEKGVLFALGTDAGTPGNFHGETAQELRFMVENVGMTHVQALQTATINGARAIQREETIGSIEVGKFADIVICKKDPTKDVTILENLSNISHVVKDGKVMVENGKIVYFSK